MPSDPADTRLSQLVEGLLRLRTAAFLGVVVVAALAWPVAERLQFDRSIESLYAHDDPHLRDYVASKRIFGEDEYVLVVFAAPRLFEADGLALTSESAADIRAFSRKLSEVPGVDPESTQNLADALRFPYRRDRVVELVEGVLLGEDHETTAVVVRLRPEREAGLSRGETIARLRGIAADHDPPAHVVGEPVLIHDMFRLVEADGRTLFRWSLAVLSLVILVFFVGWAWALEGLVLIALAVWMARQAGGVDAWTNALAGGLGAFVPWALAAGGMLLAALVPRLRWVLLPLLVVVVTIVWTEALLVESRMRLSMVSSMLDSLVTIIAVATVTHVTVHYRECRKRSSDAEHPASLDSRLSSLRTTLVELLPAVFWTCATTAIGFAALLSSSITPVRSFALMMALGVSLVLVVAALTLPGGMGGLQIVPRLCRGSVDRAGGSGRFLVRAADSALARRLAEAFRRCRGRGIPEPRDAPWEGTLTRGLERITNGVEHHPWRLWGAFLAITLLCAAGLPRLDVQTDFSRNFRESSRIVRSLEFVESHLGGAGGWQVDFPAPQELTPQYLDRVRELAARLRALTEAEGTGLTKVTALTDSLELVPTIPFLSGTVPERLQWLDRMQPGFVSSLYNPEAGRMRIILRAYERRQADAKIRLIERVGEVTRGVFPEVARSARPAVREPRPDSEIRTTGLYVLTAYLIENLLRDQLVSFLLAAAGIALMMTIALGSVRIGLASLLPNLFPIVLVVGTMGLLGMRINIATAMIASVSMGLTIDNSIHYIFAFRRARRGGGSVSASLHAAHQGIGRSLVFANLALIAGFSVLTRSQVIPLVYFGVLVSVAMLGGLIGNLTLLPLLLKWLDPDERRTRRSAA